MADGPLTKSISFDQTGDKIISFDLKTASKIGIGRIQ